MSTRRSSTAAEPAYELDRALSSAFWDSECHADIRRMKNGIPHRSWKSFVFG